MPKALTLQTAKTIHHDTYPCAILKIAHNHSLSDSKRPSKSWTQTNTWNHQVKMWKILQLEFSIAFRNHGMMKSRSAKTSGITKTAAASTYWIRYLLAAFVQAWSWCRCFHMSLHIPIRTKGYIISQHKLADLTEIHHSPLCVQFLVPGASKTCKEKRKKNST